MLKAACPDKRQAFANISLTKNSVADRFFWILLEILSQIKHKVESFVVFWVTIVPEGGGNLKVIVQLFYWYGRLDFKLDCSVPCELK